MIILLVLFVPYIMIILLLAVAPTLFAEPRLVRYPFARAEAAAHRLPHKRRAFIDCA